AHRDLHSFPTRRSSDLRHLRKLTMFITKKHLSRRTFLHGVGVTVALPFLESMVPAGTALAQTAAKGRTRFGAIYFPHGATMDKRSEEHTSESSHDQISY